jgi:hypothetical protein
VQIKDELPHLLKLCKQLRGNNLEKGDSYFEKFGEKEEQMEQTVKELTSCMRSIEEKKKGSGTLFIFTNNSFFKN